MNSISVSRGTTVGVLLGFLLVNVFVPSTSAVSYVKELGRREERSGIKNDGSVNVFSARLLLEWRKRNPVATLVFSPLSIASAFLLVYRGAVGTTKAEMEDVFGFGNEDVVTGLEKKLEQYSDGSVALLASRVYMQKGIKFKKDYIKSIGSKNIRKANFKHADKVVAKINGWVSDKTSGGIRDLVAASSLTDKTVMLAVNALYFKQHWETSFSRTSTDHGVFYGVESQEKVLFMKRFYESLPYKRVEGLKGIMFGLPYRSGRFCMYIFLPDERNGWKEAEQGLLAQVDSIFNKETFWHQNFDHLRLPKWETEMSLEGTKDILTSLGIGTAFSDNADFSKITLDRPLKVSDVVHKAKIHVNEAGTEAAAATAFVLPGGSGVLPPPGIDIIVDHPFLYFIVDRSDNTVLFQGTQTSIKHT